MILFVFFASDFLGKRYYIEEGVLDISNTLVLEKVLDFQMPGAF
jgi:hypothetical protein